MLTEHGCKIASSTYYDLTHRQVSAREVREEELTAQVSAVHAKNYSVYGARKVWLAMNREGTAVARCTVGRLMRRLGLSGARRGKVKRTTIADPHGRRADDLVDRHFDPQAPNRLWVADFTYVSTWSGWVYVAFVIDNYARRILGWRAGATMTTQLVLDALEQAIWTRQRTGRGVGNVVAQNDRGSQYASIKYTERLEEANIAASVGSVGDSYDNALAETINWLYKTELIKPRGPWRTVEQVEVATLEYVDWFNHSHLCEHNGAIPPVELEQTYYAKNSPAIRCAFKPVGVRTRRGDSRCYPSPAWGQQLREVPDSTNCTQIYGRCPTAARSVPGNQTVAGLDERRARRRPRQYDDTLLPGVGLHLHVAQIPGRVGPFGLMTPLTVVEPEPAESRKVLDQAVGRASK